MPSDRKANGGSEFTSLNRQDSPAYGSVSHRKLRPALPQLHADETRVGGSRQERSVSTKSRLLASARFLFAKSGYRATSVKDITTQAGVAVGAFYTHFRSKRDVLIVLMRELLERICELDLRPPTRTSTRHALRAHFQDLFREVDSPFEIVRAWHEAVSDDSEIAAMNAEIVKWSETQILRLLQYLLKWPNARADRELDSFASVINTQMWSLLARTARITQHDFMREIGTIGDIVYHYVFRDVIRGRDFDA
jgi:AcrR family transcriptional regulator